MPIYSGKRVKPDEFVPQTLTKYEKERQKNIAGDSFFSYSVWPFVGVDADAFYAIASAFWLLFVIVLENLLSLMINDGHVRQWNVDRLMMDVGFVKDALILRKTVKPDELVPQTLTKYEERQKSIAGTKLMNVVFFGIKEGSVKDAHIQRKTVKPDELVPQTLTKYDKERQKNTTGTTLMNVVFLRLKSYAYKINDGRVRQGHVDILMMDMLGKDAIALCFWTRVFA
ncbi:hypothetical protein RHMOL_Rhmol04G0041500 [Rhododendron molle]|uniref:Uncharacterized protein n=1 Tax=Rhododendron molle TaxID=49168 RepID=A0ACC0NZ18_RHOML|nr:hypothetical protein RHMOL_Rhmol04G0041500 [Rhododendron molle]